MYWIISSEATSSQLIAILNTSLRSRRILSNFASSNPLSPSSRLQSVTSGKGAAFGTMAFNWQRFFLRNSTSICSMVSKSRPIVSSS